MSEKLAYQFCHVVVNNPGKLRHRCEERNGHPGPHRCSCNHAWTTLGRGAP